MASLSYVATFEGIASISLICLALLPLYALINAIYNVYFHPLRSYPGPKLWAAFRFPYVYTQIKKRLPWRVLELHDQYGPIVRVAPDELAYISSSAWKEIYGIRPNKAQNPKDLMALPAFRPGQACDLARNNNSDHTRVRRLVSHAFSPKALESLEASVNSYVDLLVQRLKENAAETQDMAKWYNWHTFDVMGDFVFGESFHGLQDQRWHPWVETLNEGLRTAMVINAFHRYGMLPAVMRLVPKQQMERYNQLFVYCKEKVAARLRRDTSRPDLIHHVTKNDKEGKQMSRAELEANTEVFAVAGSDTVANTLCGVTFHLCMNPHSLEKVTREVRDAFKDEGDMDNKSLASLEYLTATLNEALRVYPPAPSAVPRRTQTDDVFVERWVPAGTTCGVFQLAANYSSSNFHNPYSFVPERWLPNPPPEYQSDDKDAAQPFSIGLRNCVGKGLAWLELRLTIVRVLWNFDMELQKGYERWNDQKMHLVWEKGPLMVKLTPVKRENGKA